MLAFIFAPFVIALLVFVFIRTINYLKQLSSWMRIFGLSLFALVLFGGVICIILGFILPIGAAKRIFTRIGFYWLGFILYFFIGIGISLICRYLVWIFCDKQNYDHLKARQLTVIFVLIFTTLMGTYGIVNAHDLQVTNYNVTIDKKCDFDELNVVLIADLHIGYNNGLKQIEDMVDTINSLDPDIVVLAGDIFDNEYEAIEKPAQMIELLRSIKTRYGKYATYGNHDIQEKILVGFTFNWSKEAKAKVQADARMNDFVKASGFELLYDDYRLINDSLYIYGRPDAHKINFGNSRRAEAKDISKDLNKDLAIIVVDHQPSELSELAAAGVDLDLCGHTHAGQMWPGTITINWLWDNAYGLKQYGNMTNIVTSGVGLFGPNMRVGSIAEVCNINIKFRK